MKKWIIFISFTLISSIAMGSEADGKDLHPAVNVALSDASVEINKDSIFSWESTLEGEEVIVKILNEDDVQIKYGCHHHGNKMTCHEELFKDGDGHHHKDPEVNLAFMKAGHEEALAKFKRTLTRRGKDLSVVSAMKVWVHEDDHDGGGHDHGTDVWTKINYKIEKDSVIFTVCHVHGEDKSFSCHYRKEGEGEPALSF